MGFHTIEEAIEAIRQGKMIILVDDEDRENEGDLVIAAEKVTPEAITFMATQGRGLICLTLPPERVEELLLQPMSPENTAPFGTAFTVSIDAREGITTGISAADRAHTIRVAIDPRTRPSDLVRPGHVFPIQAQPGGVLQRAGQTEGSVDLARLAGLYPAGVICEIMKDDGTMARVPDLLAFAQRHGLKIVTVKDLIEYRLRQERLVQRVAEARLPSRYGEFRAMVYREAITRQVHLALVMGEICPDQPVLVRVHAGCVTGDILGSRRCDCGEQLHRALERIAEEGSGVLLYLHQDLGENLIRKIQTYSLQDQGEAISVPEPAKAGSELREYGIGAQILVDLGVGLIRLMTNNPRKIVGLEGYGLRVVERVPLEVEPHEANVAYLRHKKLRLGHLLKTL